MNPFLRLMADNRNAPRRFEIVANGDAAEVFVYDAIVDGELEAEWMGGIAPQSFIKAIRDIKADTINLRINSPGGSVFAARAMEQALRDHPAKVIAHIDGYAASAATFLVMGADEVHMAKGSFFMIHKAWTMSMGNADDLRGTADLLEKIDGSLVQTYADRSKQDPEQIQQWMAEETWFTAEEAVKAGFADKVTDGAVKAHWNLAAYAKAPQIEAPAEPEPPQPDLSALLRKLDCAVLPA
jgi:ATP-dependent Clp protease, protease subunit